MELALQDSLFEHAERRPLGAGAWVELRSGWLTDADALFDELMHAVAWRAELGTTRVTALPPLTTAASCPATSRPT